MFIAATSCDTLCLHFIATLNTSGSLGDSMFCQHCGGALPPDTAANAICPHCGQPATPTATDVGKTIPVTNTPAGTAKRLDPVGTPPPAGALPAAWIGLLASIVYILKGAHPTFAIGALCLCAGLVASFGARHRGKSPWPAFFTGLLPIGIALFFALLMLRPLFR